MTTVTWWRDSAGLRYREDSDHPGTVVYVWVAPCGCRVDIRVRWDVVNARSGPLVKVAAADTTEDESSSVVVLLHDHPEALP